MFLSFLVPIPNRRECFLAVCYGDEIGDSKIMSFSEENRPTFKDEKEVLIGYSQPVAKGVWDFNWMGGGHLSTEDDVESPAIDFFYGIFKALEVGDDAAKAGARETMSSYIDQTLGFYFEVDDERIPGTYMDPEQARHFLKQATGYLQ